MTSLRAGLIATVAALAIAAPAHAATLSRSGATLTYEAAGGESNEPVLSSYLGFITVLDGPGVVAGPGCFSDPATGRTGCPADGVTDMIIRLGDLDDTMNLERDPAPGVKFEVDGGSGKDELDGTKRNDVLSGGPGADEFRGGGGKDAINGGSGNDRIIGFGTIRGGPGNDNLTAFIGFGDIKTLASRLFGGAGNDTILSGSNGVRDVVDCGSGKKDKSLTSITDKGKARDRIKRNCESRLR